MILYPPNFAEVQDQLKALYTKKAAVLDATPSYYLKQATNILTPYLIQFIRISFQFGIFPTCLKTAKIIPVYKNGCNTKLENCRPISFFPSISKIFEKLLASRMYSLFIQNSVIQNKQYSFMKNITLHTQY